MSARHAAAPAARQAALTLHALPADDRTWVLAALPPAERDQLQALLEELQSLGIPADPALVAGLTQEAASSATADWLHALDAQGSAALAGVLRDEPGGLTSAVLAILREPARAQVIAALPAATSTERPAQVPAALEQALRGALEPRWNAAVVAANRPEPSKWSLAKARMARLGSFR